MKLFEKSDPAATIVVALTTISENSDPVGALSESVPLLPNASSICPAGANFCIRRNPGPPPPA